MGRQAVEGLVGYHLNLLTAVLAIGDQLPKYPNRNAPRPRRSRCSGRTSSATSSRWHRGHRRSVTPCWIHPSPGSLIARPRHRQLLQDLPRVRRRRAREQSHAGQHRRRHHAVLADQRRIISVPFVLGRRTSAGRHARERPASSSVLCSGRLHDVPRRDLGYSAQLGLGGLPRPRLLQRGRQRVHFAACEEPQLFSEELRTTFATLRSLIRVTSKQSPISLGDLSRSCALVWF